ncbi:hypothetical protein AM593_08830, partial [Mytilus galloprovincialis]
MKLKAEVKDSENVIKETSIQSIRDLEIFIKSKGKDKQPLDICIRHVREEDKTLTEWTLDMETLTKRIAKEKNIVFQSKVNDKATLTESISNERTTFFEWLGKEKETLIKLMEKEKVAFTEWKKKREGHVNKIDERRE